MVEGDDMTQTSDLKEIGQEIARSLSYSRVRGHSAYVATPLLYPNGSGVLVRIDEHPAGFHVSDNGAGAHLADMMGGLATYSRIAASVAERAGIAFEERTFFADVADRDRLTSVVTAVANATARAADRMAQALDQFKSKKSRELFDERLRAAFGSSIVFDVTIRGGTGRPWDYDASAQDNGNLRLFTFVAPAFAAIATANIKIADTLALVSPPAVTAVLADYGKTEPALRRILSDTGSIVIGASDGIESYRLSH
ncbi:hypothetical protein [Methylobacterium sp. JK268]